MVDLRWLLDECPSLVEVPTLTVLHGDDAKAPRRALNPGPRWEGTSDISSSGIPPSRTSSEILCRGRLSVL